MTRTLPSFFTLILLWLFGHTFILADDIRPEPSPCPTLVAGDITTPTEAHRVSLVFPVLSDVDPTTLGDGDIVLFGADGAVEKGSFKGFSMDVHHLAVDGEVDLLPHPEPRLVAHYTFQGPSEGWNMDDNGLYRVRLAEEAIANHEGRFFPSKFLGGFRCAIDEVAPRTIQPTDTRIIFHRTVIGDQVHYLADVILTLNTPHVRLDWGELAKTDDGFLASITAVRIPVPVVPADIVSADDVARGTRPPADSLPPFAPRFSHTYRLGTLDPGTYHFAAKVNDRFEGRNSFTIPSDPPVDTDAPEAELAARTITQPNNDPHQFSVTYADPSGIDITTLGDSDLLVLSPCIHHPVLAADLCPSDWKAQRARLVNIVPLDRRMMKVRAIYEVEPPTGGWRARNNGFYTIVLQEDEVCDQVENCNRYQRLGGFEVDIDIVEPPIEARTEMRIDASNPAKVVAKVHVHFALPYNITGQDIRRDGNKIYLTAKAELDPLVDPVGLWATTQENLLYEIGPLRRGEYYAGFLINGHLYEKETFQVDPTPPIPADVRLSVNSDNPEKVTARVEVHFKTPHRLSQGEVTRQGNRIILSAKAEPLPVPLDLTINPPLPAPIVLEYEIGALPPGGYLAAFVMNDFPYATEDFLIEDPGPPIEARVDLEIEQSTSGETTGVAHITFATPHLITSRDIHRVGNRFIFEATARPISDPAIRATNQVSLRYPLGDLPPGDYSAAFLMNGYPYATTEWEEAEDTFAARVDVEVAQGDDGSWKAHARIEFKNPQVRITDPGEVTINGDVLMVNATAALSDTLDAPGPIELSYDLGQLSAGPKWLKYFINGNKEDQVDFIVPPVPAMVDLAFETSTQPSSATVTIQFRDHYRVVNPRIRRFGNFIILLADSDGPLPILAPLPPEPIEVEYDLGNLSPGTYVGAFVMDGHLYEYEEFKVVEDSIDAEVSLSAEVGDNVTATAKVDFKDPFVLITDKGEPRINGNTIFINATAERVTFIAPPSGDPQVIEYDLGELRPGRYQVVYTINRKFGARAKFLVPEVCEPLPHLASIRTGEEEGQWFSKVALGLNPNQQVLDWGTVRQSGNEFHVNLTVVCQDSPVLPVPVDPVPANETPDGFTLDPEGRPNIGGSPIRLVSHLYRLGELESGAYKFFVHSRGQTLGCHRFKVEGAPPRVELNIAPVTEASDEHRFGISFSDRSGLDHESIQDAKVWILGPDNYREEATLLSYGSTDDLPSTGGFGRYSVNGPGGSWDRPDNGGYRVFIEAEKVRDLQGNALEDGHLGGFRVRILAEPSPGVNVSFSRGEDGNWHANVEIISEPGQQVVVDNWGPLVLHGHSFVALATVHLEETNGPVEPLAHSYDLGPLQPGYYVFAFKSNLAHCGVGDLTVPGVEGPAIARWSALAADGGPVENRLARYYFAKRHPELRAEVISDDEGRSHLGLRYRRLTGAEGITQRVQASTDLSKWDDVTDSVDLVERILDIDGTEVVMLCLRENIETSKYRYLRLSLEETE